MSKLIFYLIIISFLSSCGAYDPKVRNVQIVNHSADTIFVLPSYNNHLILDDSIVLTELKRIKNKIELVGQDSNLFSKEEIEDLNNAIMVHPFKTGSIGLYSFVSSNQKINKTITFFFFLNSVINEKTWKEIYEHSIYEKKITIRKYKLKRKKWRIDYY